MDIAAICAQHYDAHLKDCSGFARAVANAVGVELVGLANQIVIRSPLNPMVGNAWTAARRRPRRRRRDWSSPGCAGTTSSCQTSTVMSSWWCPGR